MNKILTLDTSGYISDPPLIVDTVMNNFFRANRSQTNVHWGQIHSLPYLIATHAEDMDGLETAIENALVIMLTAHFDDAEVTCEITDISETNLLQNIKVSATVFDNGLSYDVGKLLSVVKNRISKVEDI